MSPTLRCLRREHWALDAGAWPGGGHTETPRGGGSWLVPVGLRLAEGPVRVTQTSKAGVLPTETVSLRGSMRLVLQAQGKLHMVLMVPTAMNCCCLSEEVLLGNTARNSQQDWPQK